MFTLNLELVCDIDFYLFKFQSRLLHDNASALRSMYGTNKVHHSGINGVKRFY